jgi:hypothetical protein
MRNNSANWWYAYFKSGSFESADISKGTHQGNTETAALQ